MVNSSSRTSPGMVGAKVVGKSLAAIANIIFLLSALVLPAVLLYTYYYTFTLVKHIKDNKAQCSGCLDSKYYCDKVLEYTPLPLMIIMIFNMLLMLFRVELNSILKNTITTVNVITFVWFASCLYKNVNYFMEHRCECIGDLHHQLKKLKIVSKVIFYVFVALPAFFTIIGAIAMLFGAK